MKQTLHTSRRAFKLALLCLMAFVTWGGNYCIAQETAYKTLSFPDGNSKGVNLYTETWSATISGFTWEIANFNNNSNAWTFIKAGRQKYASVATIDNTTPFDKAIGKIVVEVKDDVDAGLVNSICLQVASDAGFSNVIETVELKSYKKTDFVFNVSAPQANLYYRLKFDLKKGSTKSKKNGFVQVNKVEYYEDASNKTATSLSFDAPSYEISKDQTLQQLPTLKAGEQTLFGKTITWSSDNKDVATVDANGTVTGVGLGKANITAKFAGDDTYKTSTASYEIKVKGAPELSFPEPSYNIIANEPFAAPKLTKSPADVVVTYSSSDEKVATVEPSTGEVSIVGAGTAKITATSQVTDVYEVASASYDLVVTKFTPALSFPQTSYTIKMGDAFAPKLEGLPEGVTPAYTSSNEEVATVDAATGEVKVVGVGTTTITVTSPNTDIYKEATASYELTVKLATSKEVTIDFSTFGYTNLQKVTEVSQDGITMTIAKGSGMTDPQWIENGKTLRFYDKNTLKIASKNRIKKVHFFFYTKKSEVSETNPTYDAGDFQFLDAGKNEGELDLSACNTKEVILTFSGKVFYTKMVVTTDVSVGTITIATPEGFGTYYNSNSYILPEGLTAFGYKEASADGTLVKTEEFTGGEVVPAGAALVVKGNTGDYECYATDQVATKTLNGNLLKGVAKATTVEKKEGFKRYVLTTVNNVLGFYRTKSGNIKVPANRAYLELTKAQAQAVSFFQLDGETTGIENATATTKEAPKAIYTLSGVRLKATTTKGLPAGAYVVNGKVVIVK